MRNRQWYFGMALTVALALGAVAGAQQTQKQQQHKQDQKQTKPAKTKPAPFEPCSGTGLPASPQTMPDSPGNSNPPQQPKTNSGSGLPMSPGAASAKKAEGKGKSAFPLKKSEAAQKKANGVNAPRPTSAEANPFPEAQSEAAQNAQQKTAPPPPPQQGAYSSSDQRLPGVNALSGGPAVNHANGIHRNDPALAKKDDKVGKFYLERHNWAGAYGRYEQAAQVDPADLHAVIGLAIAADHLGKRAQAIRNYKLYLDVKPNGKHSKDALRALKRLAKEK